MANNNLNFVDELDAKKDFVNMKVRIIRRWKQSFRLDMILIDERGKKIQASVKKDLIPVFDDKIKEDVAVFINKCGVGVNDDKFPVVKNKLKLNFDKFTEVNVAHSFQGHPYGFAFVPFNDIIVQMVNNPQILNVDVIGCVTWTGNLDIFKSSKGKESRRFNFEMKDLDGRVLKCTLWGDYATAFNNFVENNKSDEHVITIIQHALVKDWKSTVSIQSDMFGTGVFINEDFPETQDLRRSFILQEGAATTSSALSSQTVYPNRLEFLLNLQKKNVDEVRETETPMDCCVVGTIALLEKEFGWFYISCLKCNKKVLNKQEFLETIDVEQVTDDIMNAPITSLWCPKEKAIATQLIPKFRVTFRVQDAIGSASFLMFDRDVSKIIGLSATDIRERQLKSDQIESYPYELNSLVNKKFAFKIAISKYNLDKKYTVYTVLKVCDDPAIIKELALVDICQGTEDSQAEEVSTVKLDEDSQTGMSSKDAFSVTGESLATELEKDTKTSPLLKRSNNGPVVESTTKVPNKIHKINIGKED